MAFLDVLRSSKSSPVSAFHAYKLRVNPADRAVHVFLEGHDDSSYYFGFISGRAGAECTIHTYACGNKQNVLDTHRLVAQQNRDVCTLFFVDRDLSTFLGEVVPDDERIYVTDYYAIENHVVEADVMLRVCNEIIRIQGLDVDLAFVRTHFEEQLRRFHKAILPVMAWILFHRRNGSRPNLNNIDLPSLFGFNQDFSLVRTISPGSRLEYLDKVTGVKTPPNSYAIIKAIAYELRSGRPKSYVRGKFEAWFFISYFQGLIRQLQLLLTEEKLGPVKVRTTLHAANFVEVVAPRATMPASLDTFLRLHLPLKEKTA